MENDVFVLLLGANAGAYALAATFSGEYCIPVAVMDEEIPDAFLATAFVKETRRVPGIAHQGLFMRALSDFYEAHVGKSLILIPTTQAYTARVLKEKGALERMFLLPQKKCPNMEDPTFVPQALFLHYVGREGSVHAVYGKTVALGEKGDVLAVLTEPAPEGLLACIPSDTPGFALYAVSADGTALQVGSAGALSPFIALASAADTSIAEWILTDYVLCEPLENLDETPEALFSLLSPRRTRKHLLPTEKERVRRLYRRHLSVTLSPPRSETHRLARRLCLHRFYRQNWEKTTKTKK